MFDKETVKSIIEDNDLTQQQGRLIWKYYKAVNTALNKPQTRENQNMNTARKLEDKLSDECERWSFTWTVCQNFITELY